MRHAVVLLAVLLGCVPAQADLLVTNSFEHDVLRYDATTGAFLGDFVTPNSGGLVQATGLTGAFVNAFVPSGGGGLSYPTGLTFGPDGDLYIAALGLNGVLRLQRRNRCLSRCVCPARERRC